MSLYVLDTDILSLYQLGHDAVCNRVEQHDSDELATTIITVEEQLSAWFTLRRRVRDPADVSRVYDRFTQNVRFLTRTRLEILSFTEAAIARFEEFRRMKLGVKANDLRIAAIAETHSAIVVTRNRSDFERIPALSVQDWSG